MLLLSRRSLFTGTVSLAAISGLAPVVRSSRADALPRKLSATTRVIEVNGKAAKVLGLETSTGFGGLSFAKNERFRVDLANNLTTPTLIHWHGQTPPSDQDGVPDLSQPALAAGETYEYDFDNLRTGTHWMHSHVGLQEQSMLSAPLIVRDSAEELVDEQQHVVMLHDFTFRDPEEILAELKRGGGAHAGHAMPGMKMDGTDMRGMDLSAMGSGSQMLNDVVFDAYLANDRTLSDPEVVRVEKGGRVRLRIINAAAASNMWVDLGALEGELTAVDGNLVVPVKGSRFPLAIAQRADIRLVLPGVEGAWPVLFMPEGVADRAGIILATASAQISRAPSSGEQAPALTLDLEQSLRAVKPLVPEPITRTEMVMLTGGDANYDWGLNGKRLGHGDTLFSVRPGERIAIMLHNMTAMSHPMHLHGHHFQVVAINGREFSGAMRDTVLVPPNAAVTIVFDADNPGTWAFHCHHQYHQNAGMMGAVAYSSAV